MSRETDEAKCVSENCRAHEKETSLRAIRERETCRIGRYREISERKVDAGGRMTLEFFHPIFHHQQGAEFPDTRFSHDERHSRSIEEETLDLFSSASALFFTLLLPLEILRAFCWISCTRRVSSFKGSYIISFYSCFFFFFCLSISTAMSQLISFLRFWNNCSSFYTFPKYCNFNFFSTFVICAL